MKGIFVVIDGMADLPCKQLNNQTPLQAAETPNLDFFASHGMLGYGYAVNEELAPESDVATLALLGNHHVSVRGVFEALGAGLKLERGDLALRANFATISSLEDKTIVDRRAGRNLTTREAKILAEAINKKVKLPCKFEFQATVQHRGVLVLRGGFSDNITDTDPSFHARGKIISYNKLKQSEALDDDELSEYTANIVNDFVEQSYHVLNEHPVNMERKKKGLLPANIILTRGAGMETPKLRQYPGWAAIVYMPLEIGIAKASGMDVFAMRYNELSGLDVYRNLYQNLQNAAKFAAKTIAKFSRHYDYFYVHFKETDVPGHDNKPHDKKQMLELIDKIFFFRIRRKCRDVKLLVTADHATPCARKTHTSDPVPILFYDGRHHDETGHFTEQDALRGALGKLYGKELFQKTGFLPRSLPSPYSIV